MAYLWRSYVISTTQKQKPGLRTQQSLCGFSFPKFTWTKPKGNIKVWHVGKSRDCEILLRRDYRSQLCLVLIVSIIAIKTMYNVFSESYCLWFQGRPWNHRKLTMSPQVMSGEASECRHLVFLGKLEGMKGEMKSWSWLAQTETRETAGEQSSHIRDTMRTYRWGCWWSVEQLAHTYRRAYKIHNFPVNFSHFLSHEPPPACSVLQTQTGTAGVSPKGKETIEYFLFLSHSDTHTLQGQSLSGNLWLNSPLDLGLCLTPLPWPYNDHPH